MKLRDKVKELHPSKVGERFEGGVCACPANYPELKHNIHFSICGEYSQDCRACWDAEYEGEEEMNTKYIKMVERLAQNINSRIEVGVIQTTYDVAVSVVGVHDYIGSVSTGISGRGLTYADACEDYIKKLSVAHNPMFRNISILVLEDN